MRLNQTTTFREQYCTLPVSDVPLWSRFLALSVRMEELKLMRAMQAQQRAQTPLLHRLSDASGVTCQSVDLLKSRRAPQRPSLRFAPPRFAPSRLAICSHATTPTRSVVLWLFLPHCNHSSGRFAKVTTCNNRKRQPFPFLESRRHAFRGGTLFRPREASRGLGPSALDSPIAAAI